MFNFPRNHSGKSNDSIVDREFEFLGLQYIPKIIGLTGPTKCGKTIIAKRLTTEYGFFYINLGSILAKIASTMGETIHSAKQLGSFGRNLRERKGVDILAHLAFDILKSQPRLPDKIVIDSFLHPSEIHFFKRRSDLILIGVEASYEVRVQQLMGWARVNEDEAKIMIMERDEYEQYHQNRHDDYSPFIDECLNLIERPKELQININSPMTAQNVYDPIDQIMENLSKEWGLKRLAAPMSSNNYPYWNQRLPSQK